MRPPMTVTVMFDCSDRARPCQAAAADVYLKQIHLYVRITPLPEKAPFVKGLSAKLTEDLKSAIFLGSSVTA